LRGDGSATCCSASGRAARRAALQLLPTGTGSYDTGRMFVASLLVPVALYLVVRTAVRHGIEDAWWYRADRLRADTDGGELTRPSGFSAAVHWVLGAFGWL
jgi:hypothetical protein